ncbi:hypothetical protein llap_14386 [Limosa lapponica baueri]|uniref:Uncharacterized protein n=1 Tax=Limosa lapponica baueri TaxID=1758121 RepID=A0A2I0TNE8_LIMLA|nr:hypothetical protein llap_14386 [Limosa lapponica baueri]
MCNQIILKQVMISQSLQRLPSMDEAETHTEASRGTVYASSAGDKAFLDKVPENLFELQYGFEEMNVKVKHCLKLSATGQTTYNARKHCVIEKG